MHRRNRDRRQNGRIEPVPQPSPTRGRSIAAARPFQDYQADLPPTGAAAKPRYLPVDDFYADWARRNSARRRPSRPRRSSPGWTATCRGRPTGSPAPAASAPTRVLGIKCERSTPSSMKWKRCGRWSKDQAISNASITGSTTSAISARSPRSAAFGPGSMPRWKRSRPKRTPTLKRSWLANWPCRSARNWWPPSPRLHRHLLATVSTPGEMGNVCNWQQQTMPALLTAPGQELAKLLGEDLPADAMPSKQYAGPPRIFVRDVRTGIVAGETLDADCDRSGAEARIAEALLASARRYGSPRPSKSGRAVLLQCR